MRDGTQAVRPTCVVELADPRAVVAAADEALLVATGAPGRSIVRIDPNRYGTIARPPLPARLASTIPAAMPP